MESDVSESSGGDKQEQYEDRQHEDSQYNSRDSHEAEEHYQEFDEPNGNLEARVQKHSKERKSNEKANQKLERKNNIFYKGKEEAKDGVALLPYHEYSDGRIEVLFEEKTPTYQIKEAIGKPGLMGGGIERGDINKKAAIEREIEEEVDEDTKNVLIKYFRENGELIAIVPYRENGRQSKTYVYKVKIESDEGWRTLKKARSVEGYLIPLPLEEVLKKDDNDYAFGFGSVAKNYFKERHPTQYRLALSGTYSMPIVSTSHSHMQTLDAFVNKSSAQSYSLPAISTSYKPLQNMGTPQFSLN